MMRKLFIASVVAATPLLISTPAQASADSTCYPDWKVKQTQMFGCNGMALLSPGNDTRINLLMLLSDRHGDVGVSHATSYDAMDRRGDAQPFDYGVFSLALGQKPPEDENANNGFDRCVSNASGQTDFEAALVAAKQKLRADEVAELVVARNVLQPECGDGAMMRPLVEAKLTLISSQAGKDFANYLLAAASFYDGDFGGARQMFSRWPRGKLPGQKKPHCTCWAGSS